MLKIGRYWINPTAILYVYEREDGGLVVSFPSDGGSETNAVRFSGQDAAQLRDYLRDQTGLPRRPPPYAGCPNCGASPLLADDCCEACGWHGEEV